MDTALTLSYLRPSFFALRPGKDRQPELVVLSSTTVSTTTTHYDDNLVERAEARVERSLLLELNDLEILHAPSSPLLTVQDVLAKIGGMLSVLVASNEITTFQTSTVQSFINLEDTEGRYGHAEMEMRPSGGALISVLVPSSEARTIRIIGTTARQIDFRQGLAINFKFNAPAKASFDVPLPIPLKSTLADRIAEERAIAEIDKESFEIAEAAIRDAQVLVQHQTPAGSPRIMFSEEGILTLQWQRGDYGVALIFAGDGVASVAFKKPGQFYAENGLEIAISEDLPTEFNKALAVILS